MKRYKRTLFRQSFDDEPKKHHQPRCAHPLCNLSGAYPAPKSRDRLREYIWFCKEHIQEYNRRWDYFQNMADSDIEYHVRNSGMWDRPTWKFSHYPHAYKNFHNRDFTEDFFDDCHPHESTHDIHLPRDVRDAMSLLELSPPLSQDKIKKQYKDLVKKFHPDRHHGKKEFEESLKRINLAYDVLKRNMHLWSEEHI